MDKKKIQQVEEVSKKVEEEAAQMDILDVLLDENNKEPIVLMDDKGKKIVFRTDCCHSLQQQNLLRFEANRQN